MDNRQYGYTFRKAKREIPRICEDLLCNVNDDSHYRDDYFTIRNAAKQLNTLADKLKNDDIDHLKIGLNE